MNFLRVSIIGMCSLFLATGVVLSADLLQKPIQQAMPEESPNAGFDNTPLQDGPAGDTDADGVETPIPGTVSGEADPPDPNLSTATDTSTNTTPTPPANEEQSNLTNSSLDRDGDGTPDDKDPFPYDPFDGHGDDYEVANPF